MGSPARNYSRPPFEPGNTAGQRHGAHSPRLVEPLAAEYLAELGAGTIDDALAVLDADTARSWARNRASRELVDQWLAEHGGDLDDAGTVRAAASYRERLEGRASTLRAELRTSIEAARARNEEGPAALESLRERGRRALEARRAALEVETSHDNGDGAAAADETSETPVDAEVS